TEREARRDAEHGRLADRRRQHAVGPACGETLADLECAAVRVEQVLAEQVDPLVALEDLVQRRVQRLSAADAHRAAGSCAARGAASACSTASASLLSTPAEISSRSASLTRPSQTTSGSRSRLAAISSGSRKSSPFECGLKRYVSRTRKYGVPVERTWSTPSRAAARTSSTSVVSWRDVATPKARARDSTSPAS